MGFPNTSPLVKKVGPKDQKHHGKYHHPTHGSNKHGIHHQALEKAEGDHKQGPGDDREGCEHYWQSHKVANNG